jgi:hypothetical protein
VAEVVTYVYEKLDQTWADYCVEHGVTATGEHKILDNRIAVLDGTDKFTVDDDGADSHPNKNAQVYDYLAIG